jgi:hypothetical protein
MNIFADHQAIVASIAPEASGVELLMCPAAWRVPGTTAAYASQGRDLRVRDELVRLNRWHGEYRGAIVFIEEPTLPLLLHELAHVLPRREPLSDIEPSAEQRAAQIVATLQWAHGPRSESVPWEGHDARWIRRAIHLHYRAKEAGHDCNLHAMQVAGDHYGLSHVGEYASALSYEPMQLRFKTFAQIEQEPMPERFVKLFAYDVATYHHLKTLEEYQDHGD